MVYGTFCREVGPPTRRPGLLQGGGPVPSHNPRGHILRPRLHPPRLDVLGSGRGEPDECGGWVLWGEKADVRRFSISAKQLEQIVRKRGCEGLQGAKGLGEG